MDSLWGSAGPPGLLTGGRATPGFVCCVSAMCPHSGEGHCLDSGFGVGWPTIMSCPVPCIGRGGMGHGLPGMKLALA